MARTRPLAPNLKIFPWMLALIERLKTRRTFRYLPQNGIELVLQPCSVGIENLVLNSRRLISDTKAMRDTQLNSWSYAMTPEPFSRFLSAFFSVYEPYYVH